MTKKRRNKFKIGDILILHAKTKRLSADKGALAVVQGYQKLYAYKGKSKEYVDVKWVDNKLRNGQMDGGYYQEDFKLFCRPNKINCKKCKNRLKCITGEMRDLMF